MDEVQQVAAGLDIAHIIQLSIAPVFTVAAIAGLLGVLSSRLGRVIDRARIVESRVSLVKDEDRRQRLIEESRAHWSRIRLINWSMRFCVSGALMICLVIVTLFVGQFVENNISSIIAALFIMAMVSVIAGLILMLIEVGIATNRMQHGMEVSIQGSED